MGFRGFNTLLLIWTLFNNSKQDTARIRVSYQNTTFKIPNSPVVKLIKIPSSSNIIAATAQELYVIEPEQRKAEKVSVYPHVFDCLEKSNPCNYDITLMAVSDPLLICGTKKGNIKCCNLNSEYSVKDCFPILHENAMTVTNVSLLIGEDLYYTKSGKDTPGLYRCNSKKCIWPQSSSMEKHFIKIIADKNEPTQDGKVYAFYKEENTNLDPDTPVWIPKVSQTCMADQGGNKEKLQNRWTSMLTARLFCGDKSRKLSYTELLDIAVVESKNWSDTKIYGLFKNPYNLRAVCTYSMADLIRIFTSNKFKGKEDVSFSPLPGECVKDSSSLSPQILNFMEQIPEMDSLINHQKVLMFNHWYTNLQVDRVKDEHDVLFLSLENGKIHKVLAEDGFIIAEYSPFSKEQQISSMLFNSKTKTLFVNSNSEMVQLQMSNCTMYGEMCNPCVTRDPYCGWNNSQCSNKSSTAESCNYVASKSTQPYPILEGSKFYMKCPMASQLASYTYLHNGKERECVSTEENFCILLIDRMSKEDEGLYECKVSESGISTTTGFQELRFNSAPQTKAATMILASLLFLIHVIS